MPSLSLSRNVIGRAIIDRGYSSIKFEIYGNGRMITRSSSFFFILILHFCQISFTQFRKPLRKASMLFLILLNGRYKICFLFQSMFAYYYKFLVRWFVDQLFLTKATSRSNTANLDSILLYLNILIHKENTHLKGH